MLSRGLVGLLGFLFSSAIAGQVIFWNQGDSPAASFRYGLFYLADCGVISAFRGFYPFWLALLIQLGFATALYWFARRHVGVALGILVIGSAAFGIWIAINASALFE